MTLNRSILKIEWVIIYNRYQISRVLMKIILIFCVLFLSCVCFTIGTKECYPLIFESILNSTIENDELAQFCQIPLHLSSKSSTTGTLPNRHHYTITNITATPIYDPAKISITQKNGNIYVSAEISYNITYNATKTSGVVGQYNGTASATLSKVKIDYVKQFSSYNMDTGFFITSISYLIESEVTPNNDYSPSASNTDQSEFNSLLKQLKNEINSTLGRVLLRELNRIIAKNALPNPFGTDRYVYVYNQNQILINTQMQTYETTGYGTLIGYNGTVGAFKKCGTTKPQTDASHSAYYNVEFLNQFFFTELLKENSMWRPLTMDQKSKTSRFQFRVIDLVEIIPKVRESFPKNKDSIIVSCAVESSNAYIQWTDEDIWFRMEWNCQVIHEASKTILLNFKVGIKYQVDITYSNAEILTKIVNIDLEEIELAATTTYPLKNSDLAKIYIKDIATSLIGQPTAGNGLKAPNIENGVLVMNSDFFKIQPQ